MSDIANARVWNDWSKEHVEDFRGETIRIPAKKFIVMSWPDAVQFRGQYTPVIRDGLGQDVRPKMIRLEKIDAGAPEFPEAPKFVCQMDGAKFDSQEELDAYIAANHTGAMVDDEARKKIKAKGVAKPEKGE